MLPKVSLLPLVRPAIGGQDGWHAGSRRRTPPAARLRHAQLRSGRLPVLPLLTARSPRPIPARRPGAGWQHRLVPLDSDRCYRAVASRDARFDGQFVTAVRTTGIYCRPSCPAPHPQARATSSSRRPRPRPSARLPRLPALPARRRARVTGLERARRPRRPRDAADRRRRGRARRRRPASPPASATPSATCTGVLAAELGAGPLALARAHRAQTARLLVETTPTADGRRRLRRGVREHPAVQRHRPRGLRRAADDAARRGRAARGRAGPSRARSCCGCRSGRRSTPTGLLAFLGAHAVAGVEECRRTARTGGRSAAARPRDGRARPGAEPSTAVRVGRPRSAREPPPRVTSSRHARPTRAAPTRRAAVTSSPPCAWPTRATWPRPSPAAAAARPRRRPRGRRRRARRRSGARARASRRRPASGCPAPSTRGDGAARGARPAGLGRRRPGRPRPRLAAALGERLPEPWPATARTCCSPTRGASSPRHGAEVLTGPARRTATVLGLAAALADGRSSSTPGATRPTFRADLLALPGIGPWTAGYLAMRVLGDPDELLPERPRRPPRRDRASASPTYSSHATPLAPVAVLRRAAPLARSPAPTSHPDQEDRMAAAERSNTAKRRRAAHTRPDHAHRPVHRRRRRRRRRARLGLDRRRRPLLPLVHPSLRPARRGTSPTSAPSRTAITRYHEGDLDRRSTPCRSASAPGRSSSTPGTCCGPCRPAHPSATPSTPRSPVGRRRCARRVGLRPQRGGPVRAVPPGAAQRRVAGRVPLGAAGQAVAAGPRGPAIDRWSPGRRIGDRGAQVVLQLGVPELVDSAPTVRRGPRRGASSSTASAPGRPRRGLPTRRQRSATDRRRVRLRATAVPSSAPPRSRRQSAHDQPPLAPRAARWSRRGGSEVGGPSASAPPNAVVRAANRSAR